MNRLTAAAPDGTVARSRVRPDGRDRRVTSRHLAEGLTSHVEVTNVSVQGFWLLVADRELFAPFAQFPWFRDAAKHGSFHPMSGATVGTLVRKLVKARSRQLRPVAHGRAIDDTPLPGDPSNAAAGGASGAGRRGGALCRW